VADARRRSPPTRSAPKRGSSGRAMRCRFPLRHRGQAFEISVACMAGLHISPRMVLAHGTSRNIGRRTSAGAARPCMAPPCSSRQPWFRRTTLHLLVPDFAELGETRMDRNREQAIHERAYLIWKRQKNPRLG
jgi:hypothetical protein